MGLPNDCSVSADCINTYGSHECRCETGFEGDGYACSGMHENISHVHVLMRDEKEGRKKQARSNKQQGKATQHTQGSHFFKEK